MSKTQDSAVKSYGTFGSGLTYQTVGSNVGKVKSVKLEKHKKAILKFVIISGLILLALGLIIILLTSDSNGLDITDVIENDNTTTIATTPATANQPTTTIGPTSPLLDRIRAAYPWTQDYCGIRSPSKTQGPAMTAEVEKDQFPWLFRIFIVEKTLTPLNSHTFVCFASLIAPAWALTSAACCTQVTSSEDESGDLYTALHAVAGPGPDQSAVDPKFYRLASYCKSHPLHGPDIFPIEENIGLIRLGPQPFTTLPLVDSRERLLITTICLPPTVGNGLLPPRPFSLQPHYLFVGVDPDDEISSGGSSSGSRDLRLTIFSKACKLDHLESVDTLYFCRNPRSREPGSCHGDSGSPMVQKSLDSAGGEQNFVAWGLATSVCPALYAEVCVERFSKCQDFTQSPFISIARHAKWIKQTVDENGGP